MTRSQDDKPPTLPMFPWCHDDKMTSCQPWQAPYLPMFPWCHDDKLPTLTSSLPCLCSHDAMMTSCQPWQAPYLPMFPRCHDDKVPSFPCQLPYQLSMLWSSMKAGTSWLLWFNWSIKLKLVHDPHMIKPLILTSSCHRPSNHALTLLGHRIQHQHDATVISICNEAISNDSKCWWLWVSQGCTSGAPEVSQHVQLPGSPSVPMNLRPSYLFTQSSPRGSDGMTITTDASPIDWCDFQRLEPWMLLTWIFGYTAHIQGFTV
jgi:hypothetical protein